MEKAQNAVIVKVNAGSVARHNDLVRFTCKPHNHFPDWQEGISRLTVSQITSTGQSLGGKIPSQFEPSLRQLTWQTDDLSAGESAWYAIQALPPLENVTATDQRYHIRHLTSHLLITIDNYVSLDIISWVYGNRTSGLSMEITDLLYGEQAETIIPTILDCI